MSPTTLVDKLGVRARSVIAGTVVVALAYSLGALAFVALVERSLLSSIDDAAAARAADVATEVTDQGVAAVADDLAVNTRPNHVVQILNSAGRVLAASSPGHTSPLTERDGVTGQTVRLNAGHLQLFGLDDPYMVVVTGADHGGHHYRIVVATAIDGQRDSMRSIVGYLSIGLPLVVAVIALATWFMVGRALAPVDRIRATVDGMSGSRLDQRVPVPKSRDEIARLAATVNQLLSRLELSRLEQQQFVADASHELRSPLATVLAASELGDDDTAAWRDLHPLVRQEALRMQVLVNDLLMLARADERGVRLSIVEVDVDDIVLTEATRLRQAGGLRVLTNLAPVRIMGDPGAISQVVRNLVDNAARAAATTIELSVDMVEGDAVIRVDDDGPGIEPAARAHVFGRFVRLDDSRERSAGGSGLGLAIVERIVDAHEGTVEVMDSTLGGARFVVVLPGRASASVIRGQQPRPRPEPAAHAPASGSRR